jgi:DNA-binding SARP family transcriptional activator
MGLDVALMGGFQILESGLPVTALNPPRQQSLLTFLLFSRGAPISRQHAAGLFWPDQSDAQARNNLRQLLHQIRCAHPDCDLYLKVDASSMQWLPDPSFRLDVFEFDQALEQSRAAAGSANLLAQRAALEQAIQLYRGDLLPSCYDDWIAPERERLRKRCLEALEQLVMILERQRELRAGIAAAQRLVQHDPLHENGYCLLMRLYAQNNDRAGALRAYQACVETLDRELGVTPEPATQEIYQQLVQAQLPLTSHAPEAPAETMIPLIGREAAWATILSAWRRAAQGQPGLVIISGEAGIGKSRLAEDFFWWVKRQGISAAKARAYAGEGDLAYSPVALWLRSDAFQPALKRLESAWLTELSRLLPELAAIFPHLPHPDPLKELWQRTKFFQGLARVTLEVRPPLLL